MMLVNSCTFIFVENERRKNGGLTEIFDQTSYEEYNSYLEDDNLPECNNKEVSQEQEEENETISPVKENKQSTCFYFVACPV